MLCPEKEVGDDVEVVAECEILIDGGDAEGGCVRRSPDPHLPTVEDDGAAVRPVGSGDDLDERRLAGAVVADETDDLPGVGLEVDIGEGLHRPEALRDAPHLEEGSS